MQVTEAKRKLNPHMAACDFTGYFIPPQCYVIFFMLQFFKFYLSALPCLPPASLSEHSLSVSLLVLLPATAAICIMYPFKKLFSLAK
jgi:hypothetical protein